MNFKHSSLKTRSATPDSKGEQGLHARMHGHRVCSALFPEAAWKSSNSESATLVKTFRETKKKKAPTQEMFTSLQAWDAPRWPTRLRFHSAWLLILLLISSSLEGSPLFYISILKFLLREKCITLGFWQTLSSSCPTQSNLWTNGWWGRDPVTISKPLVNRKYDEIGCGLDFFLCTKMSWGLSIGPWNKNSGHALKSLWEIYAPQLCPRVTETYNLVDGIYISSNVRGCLMRWCKGEALGHDAIS